MLKHRGSIFDCRLRFTLKHQPEYPRMLSTSVRIWTLYACASAMQVVSYKFIVFFSLVSGSFAIRILFTSRYRCELPLRDLYHTPGSHMRGCGLSRSSTSLSLRARTRALGKRGQVDPCATADAHVCRSSPTRCRGRIARRASARRRLTAHRTNNSVKPRDRSPLAHGHPSVGSLGPGIDTSIAHDLNRADEESSPGDHGREPGFA